MAQRMMYPTNQQAYLPLAVQYQPQYDPAFTQMMAQNLQQTQQRHDVVNAQIAEDMARRGEMFSYDPEYQQEVLGAYREDLDKIAKDYGFNYAQAASKLVSRIGEEALNPFYNLNKYKVQEAERAAQLRAQFGPEAIILNDPMATPITSGSKVEDFRADIIRASDYATVADRLGKDLKGTLTALGLSENEKFKSMLQYGSVERLTPTQIRALANDPDVIAAFRANAPTTALDNREGYEWTQSDEGIANFLYGNWAQKAYERQNLSYTKNPEWQAPSTTSGDLGNEFSFIPNSQRGVEIEQTVKNVEKTFTEALTNDDRIIKLQGIIEDLKAGSGLFQEIAENPDRNIMYYTTTPQSKLSSDDLNVQQELFEYFLLVNPSGLGTVLERGEDGLLEVVERPTQRNTGRSSMDLDVSGTEPSTILTNFLSNPQVAIRKAESELSKTETRQKEFLENNPVIGNLQTVAGLDRDQAYAVAQYHEVRNSHMHSTIFHSLSEEAKANIETWVRNMNIPIEELQYYDSDGALQTERPKQVRKKGLQGFLKDKDIGDIGIIPGKGGFTLAVEGKEYIVPSTVVPDPLRDIMTQAQNFINAYSTNDTWAGTFQIGNDFYLLEKEFVPNPRYIRGSTDPNEALPGIINSNIIQLRPVGIDPYTGDYKYSPIREVDMATIMAKFDNLVNTTGSYQRQVQPHRQSPYPR